MTSNFSKCVQSKEAIAQELAVKYCQYCPKLDIENIENKLRNLEEAGFFDKTKLRSIIFKILEKY